MRFAMAVVLEPLRQAHVRMYCVRHVGTGSHRIPFQTHAMRLQQPDDELGGLLLLAIPQQVSGGSEAGVFGEGGAGGWSPGARSRG